MKFGRFPQLPLNDGCMNVAHWLAGLGLEKYTPAFVDNGVDDAVLLRLDADDLREIGVRAVGHRRRLLDAIAVLRDGRAPDGFPAQPVPRADGGLAPAVGERRQLTMMFVDIVGFTALSARLDPEELREVLRAYQNVMAGEVARFEGIVSRFLGDGVLAYFGFPSAHEDNAERAVCASLAIIEAARRLSHARRRGAGPAHRHRHGSRRHRRPDRQRVRAANSRPSARRPISRPACRPWPSPAPW